MQKYCFSNYENLGQLAKERGDENLLHIWRLLGNSDHLYYMCTKAWADGDVHKYFSPFQSPYEGFMNYMNILQDFKHKLEK
jgi:alpha-amylase